MPFFSINKQAKQAQYTSRVTIEERIETACVVLVFSLITLVLLGVV